MENVTHMDPGEPTRAAFERQRSDPRVADEMDRQIEDQRQLALFSERDAPKEETGA